MLAVAVATPLDTMRVGAAEAADKVCGARASVGAGDDTTDIWGRSCTGVCTNWMVFCAGAVTCVAPTVICCG